MANNNPFNRFPVAGPPATSWFKDFLSDEELTEFVATAVNSGTNVVTDTVHCGAARLSGAASTDDSGCNFQADAAWVTLPAAAKSIKFTARIMLSEASTANVAADSDLLIGLAVVDTSLIASAATDGIYFRCDDGGIILDAVVRAGSAATLDAATTTNLVKDVWYRLDIRIDMNGTSGNGTVTFYVDGTSVASISSSGLPASTVFMVPSIAFQSGDNTGTKYVDVDYIGVEIER